MSAQLMPAVVIKPFVMIEKGVEDTLLKRTKASYLGLELRGEG